MKYFSMFSGIGGFEYGIKSAYDTITTRRESGTRQDGERSTDSKHIGLGAQQLTCVGFSEINKYAIQIYSKHFPNHKNYGSATDIIPERLPDFDLLVGGVPCQTWSIAGKRKGFEDSRGTMWYEYFRVLKSKQPKYFIAENVAGLLSHDKGKSMEVICEAFCELGYVIDFDVLNSKYFGVPQNRLRVFIIGIRQDLLDPAQIF